MYLRNIFKQSTVQIIISTIYKQNEIVVSKQNKRASLLTEFMLTYLTLLDCINILNWPVNHKKIKSSVNLIGTTK